MVDEEIETKSTLEISGLQKAFTSDAKMTETMEIICKIETAAEDILFDKSQLVELDRKRNQNREASRSLTKINDSKIYFCLGKTFVKLPTADAQKLLKSNQITFDEETSKIRDNLKEKVDNLYQLEGKSGLNAGFALKSFQSS